MRLESCKWVIWACLASYEDQLFTKDNIRISLLLELLEDCVTAFFDSHKPLWMNTKQLLNEVE